jgi:hypothetical protein
MRERATAIAVALGLTVAGLACSGPEAKVVDQYFNALRANDTNTLTSFAMVALDQKVDSWKVVNVGPETRGPAPLPDLVKKQKDVDAEQKKNERDYRAWGNDLAVYPNLQKVLDIDSKGGKIPPALVPIHEKYKAFNDRNRELKKAVADAKAAVEKERRNVTLSISSVGQIEDVESLSGEMVSKDVDVDLTIGGQVKPYVLTLRKYEVAGADKGPRMVSRWVIQSITPKG